MEYNTAIKVQMWKNVKDKKKTRPRKNGIVYPKSSKGEPEPLWGYMKTFQGVHRNTGLRRSILDQLPHIVPTNLPENYLMFSALLLLTSQPLYV